MIVRRSRRRALTAQAVQALPEPEQTTTGQKEAGRIKNVSVRSNDCLSLRRARRPPKMAHVKWKEDERRLKNIKFEAHEDEEHEEQQDQEKAESHIAAANCSSHTAMSADHHRDGSP